LKSDFSFITIGGSMQTHAGECQTLPTPAPRAMTRCECAGISFQEIASRMDAERTTLEEACRRTRCGSTCTACLPDLARFLAGREK
jgi:bacterioferritin-associated ferredoxin